MKTHGPASHCVESRKESISICCHPNIPIKYAPYCLYSPWSSKLSPAAVTDQGEGLSYQFFAANTREQSCDRTAANFFFPLSSPHLTHWKQKRRGASIGIRKAFKAWWRAIYSRHTSTNLPFPENGNSPHRIRVVVFLHWTGRDNLRQDIETVNPWDPERSRERDSSVERFHFSWCPEWKPMRQLTGSTYPDIGYTWYLAS